MYIQSDKINCFPTTKRASKNKLLTENSVTRLINRLLDVDAYVITTGIQDLSDFHRGVPITLWETGFKDLEFVIRGYYFNVAGNDTQSGIQYLMETTGFDKKGGTTEHSLYATIYIDKTNSDYPELYGQDTEEYADEEWQAIQFTIDDEQPIVPSALEEGTYDTYTFCLLKHMQNDIGVWGKYIPTEALFKFKGKSIRDIDDGEIKIVSE